MDELKPWPLFGYAPGGYLCKCATCGDQFGGDKRATMCLPCAAREANERLNTRPAPASAEEYDEQAWEIAVEFGGMLSSQAVTRLQNRIAAAMTVRDGREMEAAELMAEALNWILHVANDVGKGGGKPEPGEYVAAFNFGKAALENFRALRMDARATHPAPASAKEEAREIAIQYAREGDLECLTDAIAAALAAREGRGREVGAALERDRILEMLHKRGMADAFNAIVDAALRMEGKG